MGVLLTTLAVGAKADVDPNFYIYLCFGQSNMEGNAQPLIRAFRCWQPPISTLPKGRWASGTQLRVPSLVLGED